jgi:protein-S-isoprenylcysteine O-methyltransferase Ste14
MHLASLALLGLWIAWLASWFLAAGWTATTVRQQRPGSRLLQSLPIWVGALLIGSAPAGVLAASLYPPHAWTAWAAVALAALGFCFTWWARVHLGRFWSAAVTVKADHALVRSGPYALTRHPIYSGMLLAVLASALARDSIAALLGFASISVGLWLKLREEERFLTSEFGSDYDLYKRRVPALVPRLW